ncbi:MULTISPECIES: hypothetical protein [Pseudomonas]|uniref:Uncharacterized protein n=1 Tax=Pseudomonas donghuensis TaxID=1163398 RepID=A0AAP0SK51_9PSED|nr:MULTISPECIES: hypothetical protein [Pseudomonas]MDF9891972.1 hypothetical protein [Pseudomonas vranovensis]KDO01444.2 hypothetical protein BV82_0399 [Pseudomonas donghuensis]MBF4208917.1 hypothetical protein [Pseudomonas donghuensis]MBS7599643.1 hypothetical protein [Pseudomonas sp. RC2C2]MCP6691513.1 hypothetical protein [Pseudomonas donghuensis]
MTPSTLTSTVAQNARSSEALLRSAEQMLSALSDQEARLEQDILTRLSNIVTLKLEHRPALDQDTLLQLQARQEAEVQLRAELAQVESDIAASLTSQHTVRERIESIERQVKEQLALEPAWCELEEQLLAAQEANREAITGYAEIRQECVDKLPSYSANPIYYHLLKRDYGTDQYRYNFLHRWLDNKLAKRVNYQGNRSNELILRAMQTRNEEQQGERLALIATRQAAVDQHLAQARTAAGMDPLTCEDTTLNKHIAAAKARANEQHQQLAAFAGKQDPHYLRIRQNITERLQAQTIEQLLVEVQKTPDSNDDKIAAQLKELYPRLQDVQARLPDLRDQHDRALRDYERAKELERALRTDYYRDSDYSYNTSLSFDRLLADYMTRDLSLHALETLLQSGRRLVPRSSSSSGSSSSSWSSSGSSSSSSSSSGFSSSSSSGGGGFSTSDSF